MASRKTIGTIQTAARSQCKCCWRKEVPIIYSQLNDTSQFIIVFRIVFTSFNSNFKSQAWETFSSSYRRLSIDSITLCHVDSQSLRIAHLLKEEGRFKGCCWINYRFWSFSNNKNMGDPRQLSQASDSVVFIFIFAGMYYGISFIVKMILSKGQQGGYDATVTLQRNYLTNVLDR